MATQTVITDRLAELRARDRDKTITEDEFVELMVAKGKPEEQARRDWNIVHRLRQLPEGYERTMVM